MSLTVDTRKFKRAALKLQQLRDWPNPEAFWRTQAKGVMKEVIARMPPSQGTADKASKERGWAAVESDLNKIFKPVAPEKAKVTNLKAFHKQQTNSRGRTKKVKKRARVDEMALKRYIATEKKQVGAAAAGFNKASAAAGYRPPAWIWRHGSSGSVTMKLNSRGIKFKATNGVSYVGNLKGIKRNIQKGLDAQERKITRQVDFLLKKQAKRVGFKVR